MIFVFIAILLPALLGFGIAAVLLRDDVDTGLLERFCLAYPLGAGFLTFQMFFVGLLSPPYTWECAALLIIMEIACLGYWIRRRALTLFPKPSFGLGDEFFSADTSWIKKVALIVLALWAGAKLGSIFLEAWLRPIFAWDSWANWSVGAKLFYYTGGLMLDAPAADFFTQGAVGRIPSYPPHNPLMQTWMALWAGGFDDVLVKLWTPFYLLSMSVYLYRIASRELNRLMALALLVMFLSSRLMSYHSIEVYSDLPLGAYGLFALASFLQAMRGKRGYWVLAGIFSAEALFTKSEAVFFVLPLILSAAVFLWKHAGPKPMRPFLLVLSPLLLAAPWFIFNYAFIGILGPGGMSIQPENFTIKIFSDVFQEYLSLRNFGPAIIFFPLLLIMTARRSSIIRHLSIVILCYAGFFILLYAMTSYSFYFYQGTIFFRNVLTFYPSIFLLNILMMTVLLSTHNDPATLLRLRVSGETRRL